MAICFNTLADDERNQRRVKGERRDGNDPTQGPRLALGIMLRKDDHSQRNGRCSDESEVGLKFNVVCCTMKTCGTAVENGGDGPLRRGTGLLLVAGWLAHVAGYKPDPNQLDYMDLTQIIYKATLASRKIN